MAVSTCRSITRGPGFVTAQHRSATIERGPTSSCAPAVPVRAGSKVSQTMSQHRAEASAGTVKVRGSHHALTRNRKSSSSSGVPLASTSGSVEPSSLRLCRRKRCPGSADDRSSPSPIGDQGHVAKVAPVRKRRRRSTGQRRLDSMRPDVNDCSRGRSSTSRTRYFVVLAVRDVVAPLGAARLRRRATSARRTRATRSPQRAVLSRPHPSPGDPQAGLRSRGDSSDRAH